MLKRIHRSGTLLLVFLVIISLAACTQPTKAPTTTTAGADKTTAPVAATTTVATPATTTAAPTTTTAAPGGSSEEDRIFQATGYPIVSEPISIRMMHTINPENADWKDLEFFKAMKKLTNVDFEFIPIAGDQWEQQKGLALAGGTYPDVFWYGISADEEVRYGIDASVFVDLNPLIENYMPHLKKWLDKMPEAAKAVKAINGAVYSMPYLVDTLTIAGATIYYRKDMLDKAGVVPPKTVDEFASVMRKIKETQPEVIPMSVHNVPNMEAFLYNAFGPHVEMNFVADKDGKVSFSMLTEQFDHFITWMAEIYKDGLLDQETFTQKLDQTSAKITSNKVAFTTWGTLWTPANYASGKLETHMLSPLTSQWNSKQHIIDYPKTTTGYAIITDKNKYPKSTARYFDVNYAEEEVAPNTGLYSLAFWLGPEGVGFKFNDSSKTEYSRILPADTKLSEVSYTYKYMAPGWGAGALITKAIPFNNPAQRMKATESVKNYFPFVEDRFPDNYLRYEAADRERLTQLWTDLFTYITQEKAKFVTNKRPLSELPDFKKTLKDMKIDEVLEIKQRAYSALLGN